MQSWRLTLPTASSSILTGLEVGSAFHPSEDPDGWGPEADPANRSERAPGTSVTVLGCVTILFFFSCFFSCFAQVLGCLVWALIADTYYQPYPSYGWVMFVAIFFWMVTVILFVMHLFQLQLKFYMIPWSVVLVVVNVSASVLYATAFITSAASVEPYSWPHSPDYNRRASASFFACLVMIGYGISSCFSIRAWRGYGSNAATSQASISNHG